MPSRSDRRASSSGVSRPGRTGGCVDVVVDGVEEGGKERGVFVLDGGNEAVGVTGEDAELSVTVESGIEGAARNAGSEYGVEISTAGSSFIHSRICASAIGLLIRACEFQTVHPSERVSFCNSDI